MNANTTLALAPSTSASENIGMDISPVARCGQFLGDAPPIAPLPAVSDLDVETVMAEWNVISDIRWIPLVVPLLGAATACVPFLICWSVLVPHG